MKPHKVSYKVSILQPRPSSVLPAVRIYDPRVGYLLHSGYLVSPSGVNFITGGDFLTSRNYPSGCLCDVWGNTVRGYSVA